VNRRECFRDAGRLGGVRRGIEGGANERERAQNQMEDSLEALEGLLEDAPDTIFVYARCKFVPHAV